MSKATKSKAGRKTVMSKLVLGKLEQAFAMGCSGREACVYANINPDTLYNYQKEHPEFSERKKVLKETPVLKARKTILDNLDKPKVAMWFLERRAKQDFNLKHSSVEPPMEMGLTDEEKEEMKALLEMHGISYVE